MLEHLTGAVPVTAEHAGFSPNDYQFLGLDQASNNNDILLPHRTLGSSIRAEIWCRKNIDRSQCGVTELYQHLTIPPTTCAPHFAIKSLSPWRALLVSRHFCDATTLRFETDAASFPLAVGTTQESRRIRFRQGSSSLPLPMIWQTSLLLPISVCLLLLINKLWFRSSRTTPGEQKRQISYTIETYCRTHLRSNYEYE